MTELVRDQIAALVVEAIQTAQAAGDLPDFEVPAIVVERTRQAEHGDYASPVCMQLPRLAKLAPRVIAERIVAHLATVSYVEAVEIAGPGYINFRLSRLWLTEQVVAINRVGEDWGNVDVGHGERVQVEYVSANPTGPLTVGSARNAVLGDSLANVLEAAGYVVEREYYVNDAGSQVRKFGESVFARYAQALGRDEPFPEDGYRGDYITDLGRQMADKYGGEYLQLDQREAVQALGKEGIDLMLDWIRTDLLALGVEFDTWFHEKTLYESGLFEKIFKLFESKNYIVEREEALWFTSPDLEQDAVLVRSPQIIPEPDERPTYFASDTAYMWNKLVDRQFQRAIYVWGADHHGDVPRMKAGAKALGLDPERVVLILYQLVNLTRGGEEVRMSKRSGEFVTLRELLDETGPDPIRFFLLQRTSDSTVDFDLDLAVEQSDKNPVFYVQYAHARIASILRHAAELGFDVETPGDVALLTHASELNLIRKMLELTEVIALAVAQLAPHHLTFYAKDLASTFHSFYRDCRVVNQDSRDVTQARLMLTRAVRLVLARALGLLGVSAPERM
jgi:arginyl-tRNA synthetase